MNITKFNLLSTPFGTAKLVLEVDAPVTDLSEIYEKYENGVPLKVDIKKATKQRSLPQNALLWKKIGVIAQALYLDKEDVYHEILRKYGVFTPMEVMKIALPDLRSLFGYIEEVGEVDEDTVNILAYKSIRFMTTDEASRVIDGAQSEIEEMGLHDE